MKKGQDQNGQSGGSGPGKGGASTGPKGRLDREVQVKIGHQLRAMYDDVVKQGVPDHLGDIIKRFENKD